MRLSLSALALVNPIFFARPDEVHPWEENEVNRISALIHQNTADQNFTLVQNRNDAEIIVVLESCSYKSHQDRSYYRHLFDSVSATQKLLVINYEDAPVGAIPGLYSSVESPNFKPNFHLSWPHLHFPNKYVDERGSTSLPEIEWLFSFTGSCSHAFRQRLFERYSHRTDDIHVQEIKRWYNHSETEALNYVTEIQKSAFVLCPRGIASYSHRIIETLALGRVPVVIADDWTPFSIG